ncbi:MAG: hypothetical protein OXK78_07565 [Caldilineaceae bacterium]|nr:hypothetical protein [Caldilineaceae bacterium]
MKKKTAAATGEGDCGYLQSLSSTGRAGCGCGWEDGKNRCLRVKTRSLLFKPL